MNAERELPDEASPGAAEPAEPAEGSADDALIRKIDEVTAFLEGLRDDYASLSVLPLDQRERFLRAAGQVARPGPWAKRELAQAARERQAAKKRAADQQLLDATGIRQSRRQQVFTPWRHGATIDRTGSAGVQPHLLEAHDAVAAQRDAAAPHQAAQHQAAQPTAAKRDTTAPGQSTQQARRLSEPQHCYICKAKYREVHFFYDALCPSCATLNWSKRSPSADLHGRVAIITGARVKIGFQAALLLLRAGAHVVVTTRFPRDAATRYAAEDDFAQWSGRLEIFGLDLRHTPSVETFARFMKQHLARLDFLINNACQTVRRPAGFYDHLMAGEDAPLNALAPETATLLDAYERMRRRPALTAAPTPPSAPQKQTAAIERAAIEHTQVDSAETERTESEPLPTDAAGLHDPAALSQLTLLAEDLDRGPHLFPAGQLDGDLQQLDLRARNSWRLALAEVSAVELLEVQLVNAVAPFILNARLKTVMLRHPNKDKHIVNVSAVEGQFSRHLKTDRHPHTNMAKAALNMMTRTSAADYVRDGIHMNSVDTGWVTDEDPAALAARKTRDHGFHPPLDILDGAARVVDPIFTGIATGTHTWGAFLKDYQPCEW